MEAAHKAAKALQMQVRRHEQARVHTCEACCSGGSCTSSRACHCEDVSSHEVVNASKGMPQRQTLQQNADM